MGETGRAFKQLLYLRFFKSVSGVSGLKKSIEGGTRLKKGRIRLVVS